MGKQWIFSKIREVESDRGHRLGNPELGLPMLFCVLGQIFVDLNFMIVVVRERVVDLGEGQVRESSYQFLGSHTLMQDVGDDRAHRELGALDDGLPAAVVLAFCDMGTDYFRFRCSHITHDCRSWIEEGQVALQMSAKEVSSVQS